MAKVLITCSSEKKNGGRCFSISGYKLFCIEENGEEEAEKHRQLAQLIKVINTLAILFIVIPD